MEMKLLTKNTMICGSKFLNPHLMPGEEIRNLEKASAGQTVFVHRVGRQSGSYWGVDLFSLLLGRQCH
ncbi:hypothetical protein CEXT_484801 [Caerostris extrusa]|uniref:Uncharacterized protein n=1 Tax=Caerostris extrusa TaxID=172846 RepID=A0AAV4RGZ4_CAEEX|nr:hypothetical protein CEXT_484801 [Caerostris extrusa]